MKKIWTLVAASSLTIVLGTSTAISQEAEEADPGSMVIPVEIYTCKYNEGQGPADLDAAADGWNGWMDERELDNYSAWTLTKHYTGPDQEFDFIWLGAWKDADQMGSGTDLWLSEAGEHGANFERVATCGTHMNVASINYKMPEDNATPGNGVLTFSNCNVADGRTYEEVADATTAWAGMLTEAGSEASIFHWFPIYGGGGDETPDFVWLTAYENHAALGADYERMGNGQMYLKSNELFMGLVDCDLTRVYNAQSRRFVQLR